MSQSQMQNRTVQTFDGRLKGRINEESVQHFVQVVVEVIFVEHEDGLHSERQKKPLARTQDTHLILRSRNFSDIAAGQSPSI